MPQGNGQHPCGHAANVFAQLRSAPQRIDELCATLLAVQQQGSVFATRSGIGLQQRLELDALLAGAWVGIGERTRGAHRRTRTATHAKVGVDLDLLAADLAADRQRRAHLNAGVAANLLVATVRTELLFVLEELGLLELADQLAQLQQGLRFAQRAGWQPEIALRWRVLGERRGAGGLGTEIQNQIKLLRLA